MSRTIEDEVVRMSFDNAKFESGIKESRQSIKNLRSEIEQTDQGKAFNALQNSIDALNNKFSTLGIIGTTAIQNITNRFIDMATQFSREFISGPILQGYQEYELKMGSVQTIMASTGASVSEVNKYLDELNTYADKTIYSFSDMTANIGKFTNAGVDLDVAVKAIQGISNEAAVSGANAQEASRAMYNFAQALSAGYVKLIDWKSIENANMATVEFKEELIKTAVELGTVVKVGDKYQTVTTDLNGKVSNLFTETLNFNDSLSAQWMTTDVLTKTLAKYADETTEIGKKAYAAAQDVKTFSQLISTIKEAIGSGWAKTFELFIGDFEQAKELFTEINNVVGTFVDNVSTARNSMLEEALGGGTKAVKETANALESVTSSFEEYQKIANEIKAGKWGNSEERIRRLTEAGYDYDLAMQVVNHDLIGTAINMENFKEETAKLTTEESKLKAEMERRPGRELLIEGLANVCAYLGENLTIVRKAFRDVFPPMTGTQLYLLIKKFNTLTVGLTASSQSGITLRRTFKGLFSIIKIGIDIFSAFSKAMSPVVSGFINLASTFMYRVVAPIGEFINRIREAAEETDFFYKVFHTIQGIGDIVWTTLTEGIKTFLSGIGIVLPSVRDVNLAITNASNKIKAFMASFDDNAIITKFKEKMDSIVKFLSPVGNAFITLGQLVANFFHNLFNRENKNNVEELNQNANFFSGILNKISTILAPIGALLSGLKQIFDAIINKFKESVFSFDHISESIAQSITNVTGAVSDAVSGMDANHLLSAITTGGIAVALKHVGELFGGLFDILKNNSIGKTLSNINEILESVGDTLKAWTVNIKAKTLKTIAVSIGILAASLFVLSLIDSGKLGICLGALAGLFGELITSLAALDKLTSSGGKKTISLSGLLISMAAAILILSFALAKISTIPEDKLVNSVLVLETLLVSMTIVAKVLEGVKIPARTGIALIGIAIAIRILVKALKTISDLDANSLVKGLTGIGGLLLEMALFTKIVNGSKINLRTAIGFIAIATCIKILSGVVDQLGHLNFKTLVKGIGGIGVLLLELSLFMQIMNGTKINLRTAIGLITLALTLKMLAAVVIELGAMDPSTLCHGLIAMAVALTEIALTMRALPKGMVSKSVGMIGMATAILILSKAIKSFGGMSLKEIGKGLLSLGGSLLIMVLALKAMKGTLFASASILVMSVALLALVPVLKTLGGMKIEDIGKALLAIGGLFLILGVAGYTLGPVVPVILALAGSIALLGLSMLSIGIGAMSFAAGIATVVAAVGSMDAIGTFLAYLIGLIPSIFENIALGILAMANVVTANAEAFKNAFVSLINIGCNAITETLPTIIETFISLVDSTLASIADHTPFIVQSLIDILIGVINAIAVRLPEIVDATGTLVEEAVKGIGELIGYALGGLVEGILSGAETSLDKISSALNNFFTQSGDFWENVKSIDNDTLTGVSNLVLCILAITGAEIVDSLTGFKSEDTLDKFKTAIKGFFDNNYSFWTKIKTIDSKTVRGFNSLAKCILALTAVEVTDKLLFWKSDDTLTDFGDKLVEFGPKFASYADSIKDVDTNAATASTNLATALVALAQNIPNSGGLISLFTGDNDISSFGEHLVAFGSYFKQYSDSVSDVDFDLNNSVIKLVNDILTMANTIADNDSIYQISAFGNTLYDFGLQGIAQWLHAFDASKADIDGAMAKLVNMCITALENADVETEFTGAGTWAVKKYDKGIQDWLPHVETNGTKIIDTLTKTIKSAESKRKIFQASIILMNRFESGIKSFAATLFEKGFNSAKQVSNGIEATRNNFEISGKNSAIGYMIGLQSMYQRLYYAGVKAGKISLAGFNNSLKIESPSKEFENSANYSAEGYIKGLRNNYSNIRDASEDAAGYSLKGFEEMVHRVYDILSGAEVMQPTITPVLDLSEVQNGIGILDNVFANTHLAIPGTGLINGVVTGNSLREEIRLGMEAAMKNNTQQNQPPINVTIYAAEGQDPDDIANVVIDKITFKYNQRKAVY